MNELNWNDVAVRLKDLRKRHKLTIERLAEIVQVSTSFIGLIEKGENGISIENLYKLAQVFNCSLDYLITGQNQAADVGPRQKFDVLNTSLHDYTVKEIEFITDLAGFLRNRVDVRK